MPLSKELTSTITGKLLSFDLYKLLTIKRKFKSLKDLPFKHFHILNQILEKVADSNQNQQDVDI